MWSWPTPSQRLVRRRRRKLRRQVRLVLRATGSLQARYCGKWDSAWEINEWTYGFAIVVRLLREWSDDPAAMLWLTEDNLASDECYIAAVEDVDDCARFIDRFLDALADDLIHIDALGRCPV